ncbi:MAG: MaoC family dehydratase [Alphaproteobacteria bacterium]
MMDPESTVEETVMPLRMVNHFEDFPEGRIFQHHWGKTITRDEAIGFSTQMPIYEPYSFNLAYAQRLGHPDIVVPPLLVFSTVLGLSVEDLSESGGPFLGADEIRYHRMIHAGATLYAGSTVLSRRLSKSRTGFGVVEWKTRGVDADGSGVVSFRRTSLVRCREGLTS